MTARRRSFTTSMNTGNEKEWAMQYFRDLASARLEVGYLTKDQDSSALRLYEDWVTPIETKHLLDTRHVSNNHRKFIRNMTELTSHLPSHTKKVKARNAPKMFGRSISKVWRSNIKIKGSSVIYM